MIARTSYNRAGASRGELSGCSKQRAINGLPPTIPWITEEFCFYVGSHLISYVLVQYEFVGLVCCFLNQLTKRQLRCTQWYVERREGKREKKCSDHLFLPFPPSYSHAIVRVTYCRRFAWSAEKRTWMMRLRLSEDGHTAYTHRERVSFCNAEWGENSPGGGRERKEGRRRKKVDFTFLRPYKRE